MPDELPDPEAASSDAAVTPPQAPTPDAEAPDDAAPPGDRSTGSDNGSVVAASEPAAAPNNPTPDAVAEPAGVESEMAPAPTSQKRWYVVKVQSGREESIKEAIERRVKIEGMEQLFGQIVIPVEKVTQMRNGKRVVREQKLYPGYLMCEVEYNDQILYLFRETSGVGDFVGGGLNHPPAPMPDHEVERMINRMGHEKEGGIKVTKPRFDLGERVKVKDGTFAGMEGEVKDILEAKGLVRVELTIFGRPVPVELEYWQVDPV